MHAVFKKLVMLMLPYLRKYDYDLRSVDRVEGNATIMAAPRSDLYAPDLYIPMMAMFTYVILAAGNKFANGLFTPDAVHSMVSTLPGIYSNCGIYSLFHTVSCDPLASYRLHGQWLRGASTLQCCGLSCA